MERKLEFMNINKRQVVGSELLLALCAVFLITTLSCSQQPSHPAPRVVGRDAVIDVSTLRPEMPDFYSFSHNGRKVNFFVLQVQNVVSAFLDACITCYPHKQGYRSDDGSVTCRYCNMRFSIFKLEKGIGGCYPIKIEGRLVKGKYLIALDALEKAADKF